MSFLLIPLNEMGKINFLQLLFLSYCILLFFFISDFKYMDENYPERFNVCFYLIDLKGNKYKKINNARNT